MSDNPPVRCTRRSRWLRFVALGALLGAGSLAPSCESGSVEAGAPQTVTACDDVTQAGAVSGDASRISWSVAGVPILFLDASAGESVRFRAPSVAVPTTLVLTLTAERDDGRIDSDTARIEVTPLPAEPDLADGMRRGCAPFGHGVASGDPHPDGVVIWTRVSPPAGVDDVALDWKLSESPGFESLTASGSAITDASIDHTLQVEVSGLAPGTTYYYRFETSSGEHSPMGRTRTAPVGSVDHLRFAVASCSSIFSGYFNAYRRIAEREDLDLMIHLGDYVYDFVDADEPVRVPDPVPVDPEALEDWRDLHEYHLADPDLRWARAMHPWFMLWDNHDVNRDDPITEGGVQAFREWNAIRGPEAAGPGFAGRDEILFRRLSFGDLVDALLMDQLLFRNQDEVPGTGGMSILGNEQFEWLADQLRASEAAWRVIGNQKLLGTVRVNSVLASLIGGPPRDVFDTGTWDGFPEARTRLFELLASEGLVDNIVLSGDSHFSIMMDLVDDPANPDEPYDPLTREGAVGFEMLATSISRGNFDEQMRGFGLSDAVIADLLPGILNSTLALNPHNAYTELTKHGYGLLDITPERVTAEIWYSPILERSDVEHRSPRVLVPRGAGAALRKYRAPLRIDD